MRQFHVLKAGGSKFAFVSRFEGRRPKICDCFTFWPDAFSFLIGRDFISSRTKFISSRTWASPRAQGASVRPFGRSSVRPFGPDQARNLRQFHVLKAGGPKFATVSRFEGLRPKICDSFTF